MALFAMGVGVSGQLARAQGAGNLPVIRIESDEVLVPVDIVSDTHLAVYHLTASDFHLYEDGKEQKIEKATLELGHGTFSRDNAGIQQDQARTPNGKWTRFSDNLIQYDGMTGVLGRGIYYVIAYVPPPSPKGSCHKVEVQVDPRDTAGKRFTTAEMDVYWGEKKGWDTKKSDADRRKLLVHSRTEYCSIEHSTSDPLDGTTLSKQMESYADAVTPSEGGLTVRAADFKDESGATRVQVVADFPSLEWKAHTGTFVAAVLGMTYRKDKTLEARFSDSYDAECPSLSSKICGEFLPNHYETQLRLSPGDYDLRLVLSYDGRLYEAAIPVSVENYDGKSLESSGIALCKRFHPLITPAPVDHTSVFMSGAFKRLPPAPEMPFELVPLISKGIEFTPTSDNRFKQKEALVAYFEVYEPLLKGATTANVQFHMKITEAKTGQLKSDTGLRPADSFVQAGTTVIPIAQQMATKDLPKGEYRLEVQASDSAGNHTDWRTTFFTVE